MKIIITSLLLILSCFCIAQDDDIDCDNAMTTIEINVCSDRDVDAANAVLNRYLQKALERYSAEEKIVEAISQSQEQWVAYSKAHCNSIYEIWSGGTIRGVMYTSCMLALTKQRMHTIWSGFLQYQDSTPPLLPEPK